MAREKILSLNPDVVTLDVEMPGMNGIDFLKSFAVSFSVPAVALFSMTVKKK